MILIDKMLSMTKMTKMTYNTVEVKIIDIVVVTKMFSKDQFGNF